MALEMDAPELAGVGRSHVSHWVAGTQPSGRAPTVLAEALSRQLGRTITVDDLGLTSDRQKATGLLAASSLDWGVDTLTALADLRRDDVNLQRRQVLGAAAFSVAALALPEEAWWQRMGARTRASNGSLSVGPADVEAVREMISMFSRMDQRRGGIHARSAAHRYLTSDVEMYLHGTFRSDQMRRDLFSAASELAYLIGWMAFDSAEHGQAQRFFSVAVKLAAEADDPAMAGHVLRAMAHQAVDLGHHRQAVELSTASITGDRYTQATPRERALLGVVQARALASDGQPAEAAKALLQASNDLRSAEPGDLEPSRVFFFGEASLAHETACTLRDLGDHEGAIEAFDHSVKTRKAVTFTSTHAVTLGYLGEVYLRRGDVDQACATWSQSLTAMDGVRSGRTRQVATNMRSLLVPLQRRNVRATSDIITRADAYLRQSPA
ncbi:tetratricopeptide repeat protein [Kineosporia babensis]|uniref:Tat pathway signal protein n=1 Tax=Kineosporia babensis TaxID=499548 RepID=A0A9X1SYA3_9ACTN|nr:hypothetical protein [Kineosporia babensis]MCD5316135.1 hypothetical protein [Kineosporia babensis]